MGGGAGAIGRVASSHWAAVTPLVIMPPPSLKRELLQPAASGARSLQSAFVTLAVIVAVAGAGWGVWSLRPTPSYASDSVEEGSAFDVTFRVENKDPRFPLANLRLSWVLAQVRASGPEPTLVEARDVRFPTGTTSNLEPGESATFTCPFRVLIGHTINDDPGIARRAEIYFCAEYDAPLVGSLRITDDSARFFLNTRLLPPRWTRRERGKEAG
jgi:hypothetical protein